jgi:hypothetical protein
MINIDRLISLIVKNYNTKAIGATKVALPTPSEVWL